MRKESNMEALKASNIYTNYYKFGHIKGVTYSLYQLSSNNDHALLELELSIRYKYPDILLTYYNKGLYYYQFEHNDKQLDLTQEFPELIVKSKKSIAIDVLCNPPKPGLANANGLDSDSKSEHAPYVGISLLKAIKKQILYKLSKEKSIKIFGNYAVQSVDEIIYHIIIIEPMILLNGDLILCMVEKTSLKLFSSSVISMDTPENELNSNFVIYLTPSGIRCHLYDSLKILNSFTYTPPKNYEHVIHLLKLATGIDLSTEENLLWVKLIPNLQHLNNQTSKISRFIHTVDNKKYIIWPWKLCFLQFGKYERSLSVESSAPDHFETHTKSSDPLDLISEFMDFSITVKHHLQQNPSIHNAGSVNIPSFNIPSVMSTGMTSAEQKNDLPLEMNDMNMLPDLFGDIQEPVGDDFFNNDVSMMDSMPQLEQVHAEDMKLDDLQDKSPEANEEIDDLFGGYSGSEEENQEEEVKIEDQPNESVNDLFDDTQNLLFNQSELFDEKDSKFNESSNTFDIPKDQIAISMENDSPYDDPGAPLPIMPTPILPQAVDRNKIPPRSAPDTDVGTRKSIFSPILFNPLIKSNVDDKYGKGGKFYVNKEAKEPDTPFRKLRATSVTGYEIRSRSGGSLDRPNRRGLGIEFPTDEKVFLDSEDDKIEDADDDYEDDIDGLLIKNASLRNDTGDDDDDDVEEEEEEESDEDADVNLGKHSPLKLNTQSEPFSFSNPVFPGTSEAPPTEKVQHLLNTSTFNSGGFSSPLANNVPMPSSKLNVLPKFDSPFAIHDSPLDDRIKFSSPLALENDDFKKQSSISVPLNNSSTSTPVPDQKTEQITESSNCLPLILRGINVSTIPNEFLLNNIMGAIKLSASASDFNMDVDQDDDDADVSKKNEMLIKAEYLNEFLSWLGPNLIFDLGLNQFQKNLISNLPKEFRRFDSTDSRVVETDPVTKSFEQSLLEYFPLTYKVKLEEIMRKLPEKDDKETYLIDNQLSFLDDITNNEILNPQSKIKKLDTIEWDSIYHTSGQNIENFKEYHEILSDISDNSIFEVGDSIKTLHENKIRVLKNNSDIVNLNSISIRFWKYLGFDPIYGPKNFQILLISETLGESTGNYNQEFLDSLIHSYKECNFGEISKISLQSMESRPDLENINNGLILINKNDDNYNHIYRQINKKLSSLVELIKFDLINKTNRFEFDRPLLLMFLNFNQNFNSLLEISRICRNFNMFLRRHQLPLVQVFSKIVPAHYVIKEVDDQRHLKYLSNYKLTRLSMNLYNQCPNPIKTTTPNITIDNNLNLFTNIVKEPISRLNFKFFNNNQSSKDAYSDDDAFLHLAYERSIDKNWVSAAWSDPLGIVTYTKSWCNATGILRSTSQTPNNSSGRSESSVNRNIFDLHSISDQVLEISNNLFKKLNEEIIKRTSGLGGKKFLVLTRVNSIIPDDELIHWKRLSMKYKDISLIVLSVNSSPKSTFGEAEGVLNNGNQQTSNDVINLQEIPRDLIGEDNGSKGKMESESLVDFFKGFNNMPNSNNPSPNNTNMYSQNFNFNINSTTNFLSPDVSGSLVGQVDGNKLENNTNNNNGINLKDVVLQDPNDSVVGLVPSVSIPSLSTPTRPAMKVGYLMKKINSRTTSEYFAFEIHLLSCSNYWNLDSLMTIILNHYKKMITLNDILCTRTIENSFGDDLDKENYLALGLVPWHISAVSKSLNYLVHIDIEE